MLDKPSPPKKPTIFISYSHKDENWKDKVKTFLKVLEHNCDLVIWDDRNINIGEKWYPEIIEAISNAVASVCLISENYLASDFINKEEVPYLLKRKEKDGMLLLPILIVPCAWELVRWLKEIQMYPRDGKTVSLDYKKKEGLIFTDVVKRIAKELELEEKPVTLQKLEFTESLCITDAITEIKLIKGKPLAVDITRLPLTDAALFGRNEELNYLDEVWDKESKRVISFVAWGGTGKSTLVLKWLEYMKSENFRGAQRVFGWSFYSQGTSKRVTSADNFIHEALKFFGDPNPDEGSAWDKGQRLAHLVGKGKNLLVLDGLEPLQEGEQNMVQRGKINDPALERLLRQLAKKNAGLCVITTRDPLPNMDSTGYKEVELNQISKEAGRALLRTQGVMGTDAELESAVEAFGNQALAVQLLATYLFNTPSHAIANVKDIPQFDDPDEKTRHPMRIINAWEKKLGDGPELNALRILGLFNRPADGGALMALRQESIPNLTDHIQDEIKYQQALKTLRQHKLIAEESHHAPKELDAHPIIRQHFAKQLQNKYPETWRQANNCLYQYYAKTAEKLPNTLEEMQPLFHAISHACACGEHQNALVKIYFMRILRKEEKFIIRKIGAYGAILAVLSHFFDKSWDKPHTNLIPEIQNICFNYVGYALRSSGNLREAVQPFNKSAEGSPKKSTDLANLAELHLALGDIAQAKEYAVQAVNYAKRHMDKKDKLTAHVSQAYVLSKAGELKKAEWLFKKAETFQKYFDPEHPELYSSQGFLYCDWLIEAGRLQDALERAEKAFAIAQRNNWLAAMALDTLTMGRCRWLLALKEKNPNFSQVTIILNNAMELLRKAGDMVFLPLGLLARAELYRETGDWNKAQEDLDEVFDLAERCEMRLHLCDAHLEQARLWLKRSNRAKARPHVDAARQLIADTGYHRRDSALRELQLTVDG